MSTNDFLEKKVLIGIDIGGTNTVIGYLSIEGEYLYDETIFTLANQDIENFLIRLTEKINLTKKEKKYSLEGIGVAAPCGNYLTGKIENPSNFIWGNVDFVSRLGKYLSVPAVITNDANAAAFGEMVYGKAKNIKNFIVLTLGTGVGSGIVINGELLIGSSGLAGEIGHNIVETNGRKCSCGKYGCLETYISANGLKRSVFEFISKDNSNSHLKSISFDELTSKKIYDYAIKGDSIAIKTFEYAGEILGRTLSNLVKTFDLEAIFLFGGVMEAGDFILKPTIKSYNENILSIYNKVIIDKSAFNNGKSAILGAYLLIRKHLNI